MTWPPTPGAELAKATLADRLVPVRDSPPKVAWPARPSAPTFQPWLQPATQARSTLSRRSHRAKARCWISWHSGLTNTQIAERLALSVHAVKFHLAAIYRKLDAANRTEATFIYLRHTRASSAKPDSELGGIGRMDLRLFATRRLAVQVDRVRWASSPRRCWPLLSVVRVDGDGIRYRQSEKWASYARIFVTEQGFPWGRLQTSGTVDPGRFAGLAVLYANLADSDPVKRLVRQQEPRIRGTYEAAALFTPTNDRSRSSALPVSPRQSGTRSSSRIRCPSALLKFIRDQQAQNAIPEKDRVVVQLVQRAGSRSACRPAR